MLAIMISCVKCLLVCLVKVIVIDNANSKNILGLSSCGLVMYAGNHDLLCQVGNLNAKNGIESLLNSITSPPHRMLAE